MQTPPYADKVFVPIASLASRLGISSTWLAAEAMAGRLPSLQIGRRRLYHVESVSEALLQRTAADGAQEDAVAD